MSTPCASPAQSEFHIIFFHIIPMCLSSVIVRVTFDMAGIILTAAGLGFIGLGAQPPLPEWGAMISTGRKFIFDQWWVATVPGIAIFIVCLGFNLLGDAMRDLLDPHLRQRRLSNLVEIENLRVSFRNDDGGYNEAVRGVSLTLGREKLGIVGESGSGKSLTGRALLGVLPPYAQTSVDAHDVRRHRPHPRLAGPAPRAARRPHGR